MHVGSRARLVALAIAVILALTALLAAASLLTRDDRTSGIRGRVTTGCVVEGCHPKAVVGLQRIHRWDPATKPGEEFPLVKKFSSDPDGTFEVLLPPGHYLVDQD